MHTLEYMQHGFMEGVVSYLNDWGSLCVYSDPLMSRLFDCGYEYARQHFTYNTSQTQVDTEAMNAIIAATVKDYYGIDDQQRPDPPAS